jgi:3-deoxy-D-manno-octulosonic-acid transferase
MLTHTSPSVQRWPLPLGADRVAYLPAGNRRTMEAMFARLSPAAVVFARGDLWPALVAAAGRHRVPVLLIGGAVDRRSTRLRLPIRAMLRRTYATLQWAGVVSAQDAARLRLLGVREGAIAVTGDPRHDQILERPASLAAPREVLQWAAGDPVLIAGSTEPEDDGVLLAAHPIVAAKRPEARLVVVPHEPRPPDHAGGRDTPVRFLATVGALADLYQAAAIAYVGGGFKRRGLHNVAEPAAWSLPLLFGDGHGTLPDEASRMLAAGGAVSLPRREAVERLAAQWIRWLVDPAAARRAGLAARRTITSGAADRSAGAILQFV